MENKKATFVPLNEVCDRAGITNLPEAIFQRKSAVLNGIDEIKSVKYQRWLIEVGDLQEQLQTQLETSQDRWMEADQFKSWLVKSKSGNFHDVEMAMKEVYSHIDQALFWIKIIRGEG